MSRILRRLKSEFELAYVYCRAKLFGLDEVVRYLRNPAPNVSVRLLRKLGATIGEETTIKGPLYLDNVLEDIGSRTDFGNLQIGENVYIGLGVTMDLANVIMIADNAVLSGNVSILTHADCNRSPGVSAIYPRVCKPVRIATGSWIGFGATLLAGVEIGETTVVAAHSLVNQSCDACSLYAGIPAQKKMSLPLSESLSDTPKSGHVDHAGA
ncbi:Galactoside O-acetyltransferase [Planctomycetes bacterium CA13]|uniref:Galactoside O-acetyltransferase n=1 Tax=Novipirellula herctigrandis TaxID=2527986 RepID=A0A5C5YW24_9BACT|nr:Galactoside O-acetyltransferase [Planctomycetes bacterium CA13]